MQSGFGDVSVFKERYLCPGDMQNRASVSA